jgi:hypothetical protein
VRDLRRDASALAAFEATSRSLPWSAGRALAKRREFLTLTCKSKEAVNAHYVQGAGDHPG